jgi:hypothetical protein
MAGVTIVPPTVIVHLAPTFYPRQQRAAVNSALGRFGGRFPQRVTVLFPAVVMLTTPQRAVTLFIAPVDLASIVMPKAHITTSLGYTATPLPSTDAYREQLIAVCLHPLIVFGAKT